MNFWHRFKHLEMCVRSYNQVVLGHGARDKNQGQLVIRSLNIVVLSHTHKAMKDIYNKILIAILFLYEVSWMPIKERLFAKPCILWSPLALNCYLLVFIRPASVWQLSPKFTDSYIDWRILFPQEILIFDSLQFPLFQKIVSWVRPGGIYWLSICFHTKLVTLCWFSQSRLRNI